MVFLHTHMHTENVLKPESLICIIYSKKKTNQPEIPWFKTDSCLQKDIPGGEIWTPFTLKTWHVHPCVRVCASVRVTDHKISS